MFWHILAYSLIAVLATALGIYLVLIREDWSRKNSVYLISLSAGVLLATALVHLLPEALTLNQQSLLWFMVTFLMFYIIEHGLILHACNEENGCEVHPIDRIAVLGMGLHSLLDGVIIGVGFEVSYSLGALAALSVLLHRLPDGIAITSVLIHANYPKLKVIFTSLGVAAAVPLGSMMAFIFLRNVNLNFLGGLVAAAAGSFIYVAASDLIPEIHKKGRLFNIIFVLVGVAITFLIKKFFS